MVFAKRSMNKKGVAESPSGAGGAAFLVLVITLLVIFYILFLPPSDRAALLGDGPIPGTAPTISGGYSHLVGSVPFSQSIGELTYVRESTIERSLASLIIYTETEANIIASVPQLYVKNSAYDQKDFTVKFAIDPRTTEDVQLSFNVLQSDGNLEIYLNGELLQDGPVPKGSPLPITLPPYLLKQDNVLHFSVSSPGFAFWTMNQYELSTLLITGDITNDANSAHTQNVFVSETEKEFAQTVELEFYPDCNSVAVGPLRVTLNGQNLFNGIPDCGLINFVSIDPSLLVVGSNTIGFSSSMGSYVIDQLELEVKLEDPGNPVFYFDLNEDLFVREDLGDRYCGKIDGYCPDNCEIYDDKDCCFDQSNNNFWCDARPDNVRDRCVNQVLASFANNCPSGYEDRNSEPNEDFEGICGDDNDDFCPIGCSSDYDKDCCYAQAGNQFWCDDIPFTGVDNTCTSAVSVSECNACPDGYKDEDGDRPNCPAVQNSVDFASEDELKSGVDIILEAYFTDQEYKRVDFIINGYAIPVDTYNTRIYRNINEYVHEGTNSLELKPRDDVTISQVRIVVE